MGVTITIAEKGDVEWGVMGRKGLVWGWRVGEKNCCHHNCLWEEEVRRYDGGKKGDARWLGGRVVNNWRGAYFCPYDKLWGRV